MTRAESKSNVAQSAIIFSASTTRFLSTSQGRLPPTYIGLRRVRPSSRIVKNALLSAQRSSSCVSSTMHHLDVPAWGEAENPVRVYKTVDPETGEERRMTKQEKKAQKNQERLEAKEKKVLAKGQKQKSSAKAIGSEKRTVVEYLEDGEEKFNQDGSLDPKVTNYILCGKGSGKYVQLEMDVNALKEELADIQGERSVVPPVALSPPLARMAILNGTLGGSLDTSSHMKPINVIADDELASQWAKILRQSMHAAETTRQNEDLRALPYIVNPEVWTRMRPKLGTNSEENVPVAKGVPTQPQQQDWAFCQLQPDLGSSSYATDADAVVQLLHQNTSLHISCGAKFGSDYLIYDGPRSERHAFAGLRLINFNDSKILPIPGAYDMTGFVRGLNTAGKLALLATVVRGDDGLHRVAIVDLALEKVVGTTSNRRSGKKSKLQNLAKN